MARRSATPTRRFPKYTVGLLVMLLTFGFLVVRTLGNNTELGSRRSHIMLAWTTGKVDAGFAPSAAQVPGVEQVAEVRNGIAWLTSWGATGAPAATPPAGFFVPVEVAAVNPSTYSAFVPEKNRPLFEQLTSGGAILGRTGAELRGISDTGTLQFRQATVPVIGVVDDDLVASHEVIVSQQTAAALGIDDPKYVLIALDRGTSDEEVADALKAKIPSSKKLGTRTPDGDAKAFRPGGAALPQAEIKQKFGEFAARPTKGAPITIDPNWIESNTSNVTFPLLGTTRCHNALIPMVKAAMDDVAREGLSSLVRRSDFGGCFAPRLLNSDPNSGISRHAWGAAIDFNVSQNPQGVAPKMDRRLIDIFARHGLTWGGGWLVPDGMHFEYFNEPD